jgi:hypothetical protein
MQDSLLREVAEYPNAFGPLGANEERIETDRYTLWMGLGRSWNTVQRQRFAEEEVDEVLAEVGGLLCARGRERTQWEVGGLLCARGRERTQWEVGSSWKPR